MNDMRYTLEGLFVEAAIIEHLTRSRVQSKFKNELDVGHFGILGYFTRTRQGPDSIAGIAWSFQESEERIATQVQELADRGYVDIAPGISPADSVVSITEAGKMARADALERMGPEFLQFVSEISEEDLRTTHRVLHEIRLVMDNLPDR